MSLKLAILLTIVGSATASAETPSVEEACAYFAETISVTGSATQVEYEALPDLSFQKFSLSLERYQTLLSQPINRTFGVTNASGEHEVHGAISAQLVCFADEIERRVLWIDVIDGPDAGQEAVNSGGSKRQVGGPIETRIETGSMTHEGKY
ncbi:MAG: hypothetical protein Q8O82_10190 [Pseudorhodobacter sp.]|nr:hypothetical protein [Pseudorhodobacter sp.]